ncbi:MAG TPA: alpha/beta hydrolase [Pseudonocardia sp.]|jgi:hypothetical protein
MSLHSAEVESPIVPRYLPLANGMGFLDGFEEHRAGGVVASSDSPFGRDAVALPSGTAQEIVRLVAQDGGHSRAILYRLGGERTAVLLMHPRADVSSHYLVPALLDAGYAVLGAQSRYFNNDEDCRHEAVLADVAAGLALLREHGYQHVVLLGNSGGGSLFSYYQAMAQTSPPHRHTHTPGGSPYDLNALALPPADGLLLLATHLGEGKFLMDQIDPSVTDEDDPLSCDDRLDMYNPANGFRRPPESSKYSQDFLERYRAAQRQRVARLDALARQQLADSRRFTALLSEAWFASRPAEEQVALERRAQLGRYLMIARTDANPASCDLSLHPSQRAVGSLQGPRPDLQNYQLGYFAHCMTPEGWLSTWSGLSSRASVLDTISVVTVPTCVLNYEADNAIFPEQAEAVARASGASDITLRHIGGDHYGVGTEDGGTSAKGRASEVALNWLGERFPSRS